VFNLVLGKIKKVLVVDDSAFMRKVISSIINSHPELEVIGTARNGRDAIDKVMALKPDVVTLDIEMPIMNGLEALRVIMQKHPVPVVMLSSTTKTGAENTMLAIEYGAFDFVAKPGGAISLKLNEVEEEILEKVIAASGVQISKLKKIRPSNPLKRSFEEKKTASNPRKVSRPRTSSLLSGKSTKQDFHKMNKTFVMIGTSTGGPRALQEVLINLPKDLRAPILIVQHMPPGFTKSLADRLDSLCEINVKEAESGEPFINGTAYIAPGGKHLKVKKIGASYVAYLDALEAPRSGHRPSVDVLFESASELANMNYLAVVMTGMGYDGRAGMEKLKEIGQTFAIAESKDTSIVYGMPKAIVDAELADEIVDLQDIAASITRNLKI